VATEAKAGSTGSGTAYRRSGRREDRGILQSAMSTMVSGVWRLGFTPARGVLGEKVRGRWDLCDLEYGVLEGQEREGRIHGIAGSYSGAPCPSCGEVSVRGTLSTPKPFVNAHTCSSLTFSRTTVAYLSSLAVAWVFAIPHICRALTHNERHAVGPKPSCASKRGESHMDI
jgi:hypothetical protein